MSRRLGHFRGDLMAQLRREYQRGQVYAGFNTLVELADGNPRNFMVIMRLVFTWAEFMELLSPRVAVLPVAVQTRAVLDASEWFYRDSEAVGPDAQAVSVAIKRLGDLLERIRFSEKPVESSLCTVTVDLDACSADTARIVKEAESWSVLVHRPNRRDRNEERQLRTLQINRMLAPRWNLPIGRRGVLALSRDEAEAIFGKRDSREFAKIFRSRLDRLNFSYESSELSSRELSTHPDSTLF